MENKSTRFFGEVADISKVSFVGRNGGGKSNPIIDELVSYADKIKAGKAMTISKKTIAEFQGRAIGKETTSNISYRFKERTGIRLSVRHDNDNYYFFQNKADVADK